MRIENCKLQIAGWFAAALLAGTALGADTNLTTIFFPVHTMTGTTQGRVITLTPAVNPLNSGTNLYWAPAVQVTPTNGMGWASVVPNKYQVSMDGLPGSFTIYVPQTNVVQDVRWLTTNVLQYAPFALAGGAATNVYRVAAGSGVTVQTNGLLYTVSASGGGAGVTNNQVLTGQAGAQYLTVTNTLSAVSAALGSATVSNSLTALNATVNGSFAVTGGASFAGSFVDSGSANFVNLYATGDLAAKTLAGNAAAVTNILQPFVVILGDSTVDYNGLPGWQGWAMQLRTNAWSKNIGFYNLAISGDTLGQDTNNWASRYSFLTNAESHRGSLAIVSKGLNDGGTALELESRLTFVYNQLRADGFKILAFTILAYPTNGDFAAFTTVNAWITNNNPLIDGFVDQQSLGLAMGDPAWRGYSDDPTHLDGGVGVGWLHPSILLCHSLAAAVMTNAIFNSIQPQRVIPEPTFLGGINVLEGNATGAGNWSLMAGNLVMTGTHGANPTTGSIGWAENPQAGFFDYITGTPDPSSGWYGMDFYTSGYLRMHIPAGPTPGSPDPLYIATRTTMANSLVVSNGTISGNASGASNAVSAFGFVGDTNVNAFLALNSVNAAGSNMLYGFATTLEAGGLWPSLVDAVILKTNLGASASLVTSMMGRTGVVAGLSFTTFGAMFNGSSSRVAFTNLPDCRTNTIVVVDREPAISQYSSWTTRAVAGLWATYQFGERIGFSGYYVPYFVSSGTDSGFNGSFILNWPGPGGLGNGIGGYEVADGFRHTVAMGFSSNYVTAWFDGWAEYPASYYGSYPLTQPATNLYIGAEPAAGGTYTLYHTGEISAVLVFSNVLTSVQMRTVEQALRWLESGNENVIVLGDSTAGWAAPLVNLTSETAGAGWPSVIANNGKWNGNVNFHVLSCPGMAASAAWAPGGAGYITGWLTNELVSHGLGGPVTKLSVFVDFGHNDRGVTLDSLATSEIAMSNLCLAAKSAGAEVWTFTTPYASTTNGTLPGAMWWTAAQEAIRQQENQWLRSNPGFYDHLVDRDLLFTVNEANYPDATVFAEGSLAGVHLAAGGNLRLADAILGQANGVPIYTPSYSREGVVTSLERGALFVVTNGPVSWPPSPPMPGAIAMVSSNGFPYMLLSTNGTGGVSTTWTGTNKWGW